jgi:NADP-dependent aldehyde dehydrogenase
MSGPAETTDAQTDSAELDRVLAAAVQAVDRLAAAEPAERATWLEAVAAALDADADRLVPLAAQESHLTVARLKGELTRTTFQLRLFASVVRSGEYLEATIDHADADWGMGPRPDLRRMLRPLGPVAVFAASNFPFAFSVAGGDTASALAAGAPVVVKAHPGHPRLSVATADVVSSALLTAGAPEGTFALVSGMETGRALVLDPRITATAFTGSLGAGRALFDLASSRPTPIPFYGELGSVNPAFVTAAAASARPDEIAAGFVASMSLGVGQFCTKPGLLFIPTDSGIADRVVKAAADVDRASLLNSQIAQGYGRALDALVELAGVDVLFDGGSEGLEAAPTIARTTAAMLLEDPQRVTEERFGPAALLVEYGDEAELLQAAAALDGQLTATVHGVDTDDIAAPLLGLLAERAGRVLWNGWPTGVSVTYAMQHGGPYPATTSSSTTSVGTSAIGRFLRPVSYQSMPQHLLPPPLRDSNPWSVPQRINGVSTSPS